MIPALLLGREGSVGFPGKNTHLVLGRPMMAYPLLAALSADLVDEVYVSTDSPRIKEISRMYGAEVIDRPAYLCTKEALGEDAFVHGYHYIRQELGKDVEMFVLLFCNAPTVLATTIDEAIGVLRQDKQADSAVTVSCYNMFSPVRARKVDEDGYLQPFVPFEAYGNNMTINCDRDAQGDVWFADVALSVVRPHCLEHIENGILPQKWMGIKILPVKQWGGIDVDFEWQIPHVSHWLEKHGFTDTQTPYREKRS